MKPTILLFTSPTCPHCPMAKKFLEDFSKERNDVQVEFFDSFSPEDQEYFKAFEIRSVPTFVVQKGSKNFGFKGTPTRRKLDELIEKISS